MAEFVESMLFVKLPGKQEFEGRGEQRFRLLPRTGEYISIEGDGDTKGGMFKVVGVVHPEEPEPSCFPDVFAIWVCEHEWELYAQFN